MLGDRDKKAHPSYHQARQYLTLITSRQPAYLSCHQSFICLRSFFLLKMKTSFSVWSRISNLRKHYELKQMKPVTARYNSDRSFPTWHLIGSFVRLRSERSRVEINFVKKGKRNRKISENTRMQTSICPLGAVQFVKVLISSWYRGGEPGPRAPGVFL